MSSIGVVSSKDGAETLADGLWIMPKMYFVLSKFWYHVISRSDLILQTGGLSQSRTSHHRFCHLRLEKP